MYVPMGINELIGRVWHFLSMGAVDLHFWYVFGKSDRFRSMCYLTHYLLSKTITFWATEIKRVSLRHIFKETYMKVGGMARGRLF